MTKRPKIIQATEAMLKKDLSDILAVALKAVHEGCVDGIYGIPRGGLPLAVLLSNRLSLPLLMAPTKQCIVVDDIFDTGVLGRVLVDKYCTGGKSKLIVWWINEDRATECRENQIYYCRTKKAKDWVKFFWE